MADWRQPAIGFDRLLAAAIMLLVAILPRRTARAPQR
jgi:hypothetical protein